jgi:selenium metabolism protein YedF
MVDVDARGLSCPLPVVRTKNALEALEAGELTVLIERSDGCENVVRFAESQGCTSTVEERDGLFYITICKKPAAAPSAEAHKAGGATLLITTAHLGRGSEELGRVLMEAFLNTLADAEPRPHKIMFLNEAVTLTTEGSNVLRTLRTLEEAGVGIFSCGTCLDYYGLKEKLEVGVITNMYDTVHTLLSTNGVVTI